MLYNTILADPPWPLKLTGKWSSRHHRRETLPYPTMTVAQIAALPIADLATPACHLWLWTTNQNLHDAFHVIAAWDFTYMTTITWKKQSGHGAYFANITQHLLFAYRRQCQFHRARYQPTFLAANKRHHSQKPEEAYQLIESISDPPRLELFARTIRPGWDAAGNDIDSTVILNLGESWQATRPPQP